MFNLIEYLKQTQVELKKVTWPDKNHAIEFTQVVIVVSLMIALYLGILDIGFNKLVSLLVQ